MELPDDGSYGFLLPANQIKTVGAELWAATGVVSIHQDLLSVVTYLFQLAKEAARHPTGADPARENERKADVKLGLE